MFVLFITKKKEPLKAAKELRVEYWASIAQEFCLTNNASFFIQSKVKTKETSKPNILVRTEEQDHLYRWRQQYKMYCCCFWYQKPNIWEEEKKGSPNSVPWGQSTILSDPLSVQQEPGCCIRAFSIGMFSAGLLTEIEPVMYTILHLISDMQWKNIFKDNHVVIHMSILTKFWWKTFDRRT